MSSIKCIPAFLLFLAIYATPDFLPAQSAKDIFSSSETPITYLGIDFSNARLIGDAAADAYEIKTRIYSAINQVIINEPKKYDINKAFSKTTVNNDLGVTESQNKKAEIDSIKSFNKGDFTRFNAATIDELVKEYPFNGKKGIGLAFIVEGMSKTEEKAAIWVTFINMNNGKVLFTERMLGKSGGFGFRNYWARPIAEILEDIKKSKYKQWSASYK